MPHGPSQEAVPVGIQAKGRPLSDTRARRGSSSSSFQRLRSRGRGCAFSFMAGTVGRDQSGRAPVSSSPGRIRVTGPRAETPKSNWGVPKCEAEAGMLLGRELPVDVPAVPERHHHHEENVVANGVEDAIVAYPDSVAWPPTQRPGRWRPRVLSQQSDRPMNTRADRGVQLLQGSNGGRTKLDPVAAHVQPRSALTRSHGMLSLSSAIALSKAATSSASSMASTNSWYRSALTSTAAGRP